MQKRAPIQLFHNVFQCLADTGAESSSIDIRKAWKTLPSLVLRFLVLPIDSKTFPHVLNARKKQLPVPATASWNARLLRHQHNMCIRRHSVFESTNLNGVSGGLCSCVNPNWAGIVEACAARKLFYRRLLNDLCGLSRGESRTPGAVSWPATFALGPWSPHVWPLLCAGPRPRHFCAGRGLYDGQGLTLRWAATPLRLVPLTWGPEQCPTQRVAIPGNLEISHHHIAHTAGTAEAAMDAILNLNNPKRTILHYNWFKVARYDDPYTVFFR